MNKFRLLAAVFVAVMLASSQSMAGRALNFNVVLTGDQEVPPVATDTMGRILIHINRNHTQLRFRLDVVDGTNVLGAAGAHLHCAPAGVNGPIITFLAGPFSPGYSGHFEIRATLTDDNITGDTDCGSNIDELVDAILAGNVYANVHTPANPGGEIRGQVE